MLQTYILKAMYTQCTFIQIFLAVPYPYTTYFVYMASFSISVIVY